MKQILTTQPEVYNDLWGLIGFVGAALLLTLLGLWTAVVQLPLFLPV